MSTGNPLEQLRRRLQSPATPTAFAALAEDYRRAGRFADAITTCREGLARYPGYASARVTLGRALLDSGDVPAAVTELELAVAQSPDNLAAGRALQSALAARGDDAAASPVAPPMPFADLPLRAADQETTPIQTDVIGTVLGARPDGPQEFGLDADWSIPDASQPTALPGPASLDWLTVPEAPAGDADDRASAVAAGPLAVDVDGEAAHTEASTLCFTPSHLQGEEPAGIWETPVAQTSPDASTADGARVMSWAIDPPDVDVAAVSADWNSSDVEGSASVWDAPTIAAPPVGEGPAASASDAPSSASEAPDALHPDNVATSEDSEPASLAAARSDDASSSFWSGVYAGEPADDASEPFVGWGNDAPPMAAGADRSPWSDDAATGGGASWTVPDGPSASWALGNLDEAAGADATPFVNRPEPHREPADLAVATAGPAWAGSLKSALGEVFALAGGESREAPVAASPLVANAMADAAVEAAIEDAATHHDGTSPILVSLEQMLVAVRARRAALSGRALP